MIVKNEAANLEACLTPVLDLVDDIVVVDTGLTDDTKVLAARLGARVFDLPWCDDFSAARNEALRHAVGDWVFILDGDDRIPQSEREKLRALFASLGNESVGYVMRRISLAADGGIANEIEQVLLFRRRPNVRWQYRVHEQIAPSIIRSGGRLRPTAVRVIHTGYRDEALVDAKNERNLRLVERDLEDHPKDPFLLFYRGTTLTELGRFAEAIVALTACRTRVPPKDDMGRALALCLARAFDAEGRASEALDVLRVARRKNPRHAGLTVAEAEMQIRAGDVDSAASSLASVATRGNQGLGQQEVRSRMLLGEALLTLGQHDNAERVGRALIAERPAFGGGWLVLADALLARGKLEDLWTLHAKLGAVRGAAAAQALIIAAVRAHTGTRSEAIDAADAAMREHPRDRMLPQLRARLELSLDGAPPVPLIACLSPPWVARPREA